jgi:hypothetical protein
VSPRPLTVWVGQAFILLNALLWLAFGVATIIRLDPGPVIPDDMRGFMSMAAFAIAAILLGSLFFLFRRNRNAYYLVIVFFAFFSLAIFFDDVGWSDLVFLGISLMPLILLIVDRKWYVQ